MDGCSPGVSPDLRRGENQADNQSTPHCIMVGQVQSERVFELVFRH
jgi:hypothetical protein